MFELIDKVYVFFAIVSIVTTAVLYIAYTIFNKLKNIFSKHDKNVRTRRG